MPCCSGHSAARFRGATGLAAAALVLGACASVPTQSASMQASPNVTVSASRLQLQVFELGRAVSALIEEAADSIEDSSTDPVVRRTALLWKVSGIPLVQEAALRIDPLVAGVDLVALTMQQLDYFTTGAGRDAFGPQQFIAVAAARESERLAIALAKASVRSGTYRPQFEANVRQWAADHPMHGPTLTRASVLNSEWEALGISTESLQATIANVDRTLVNITYRLSYLNETLAAQARWNAELALGDVLVAPQSESIYSTFTSALGSVGMFADSVPLQQVLDQERLALMADVDRQRVLAFEDVAAQVSILRAALTSEREALMAEVAEERVAIFASADTLAARSIIQSEAVLRRLVLQIVAGALVVVLALLGCGMILIKRWKTATA